MIFWNIDPERASYKNGENVYGIVTHVIDGIEYQYIDGELELSIDPDFIDLAWLYPYKENR